MCCRLTFFNVHTLQNYTENSVTYIAPDRLITKNLIFSEIRQIFTAEIKHDGFVRQHIVGNPDDGVPSYQEGTGEQAIFSSIQSFEQLDSTFLIVADSGNHVFRRVNRRTRITTLLAGTPNVAGNRDGTLLNSQLNSPHALARDPKNPNIFYTTEPSAGNIRILNIGSREGSVSSLRFNLQQLFGLAFGGDKQLFIATRYEIMRYDVETKYLRMPTKTTQPAVGGAGGQYADGPISMATFNTMYDIKTINRETLLVADSENFRLRVLDLSTELVSSICSGDLNDTLSDGNITDCVMDKPISLTRFNSTAIVFATRSSFQLLTGKID